MQPSGPGYFSQRESVGPKSGCPSEGMLPMQEMQVRSLGWEDPLEQEIAAYSSILTWKMPRTEEPGGLQSVGWQRVGHD